MKDLVKRIIREAINRSFGSMNDLARYRDINLDSPSSISRARSSQGLKASNVIDSKKNVPFNDKVSRVYTIMLRYIGKKFKLKPNSNDLRERGKELSNFIKNFLTKDEVEKFYYRLSRFNSNTAQFKRICEQILNYMENGQMSDIDVYDNVDMGDENDEKPISLQSYSAPKVIDVPKPKESIKTELDLLKNEYANVRKGIQLGEEILTMDTSSGKNIKFDSIWYYIYKNYNYTPSNKYNYNNNPYLLKDAINYGLIDEESYTNEINSLSNKRDFVLIIRIFKKNAKEGLDRLKMKLDNLKKLMYNKYGYIPTFKKS